MYLVTYEDIGGKEHHKRFKTLTEVKNFIALLIKKEVILSEDKAIYKKI
jgi:hypothetical protein